MYKLLKKIDWKLLLSVLSITIFGLIIVNSAVSKMGNSTYLINKQLLAFFIGLSLMIFFMFLDYRIYYRYSTWIYFTGIFLLIIVLVFGKTVKGSRSWLDFNLISFQPIEFVKIALVLFLATYFDKNHKLMYKFKVYRDLVLFVGIASFLIIKQPDFGSLLVFFPITLGMLFVMGVSTWKLMMIFIYGLISISIPIYLTLAKINLLTNNIYFNLIMWSIVVLIILYILWYILNKIDIVISISILISSYIILIFGVLSGFGLWSFLKNYQKRRIATFLYPELDPLGAGYNIIQSKVAVGSGGLFGKGLFSGTQIQLGFLPERHTDFIFSVIGEELGFIGSTIFVLLLYIFIYRIYKTAKQSRDRFGSLIAVGFLCMFAFCIVVNLGVVLGLMPVTGLPLSFVSYGGSNLVMSFIAVGILLNIGLKRYLN